MQLPSVLLIGAMMAQRAFAASEAIPGYGIEELQWDIEVFPGKFEALNGTAEEVQAQALQINPDFKFAELPELSQPETRSLISKRNVQCGNWPLASKYRIQQGMNYLRTLNAAPRNGPGPGNCGRVSCSYKSAIWWCNDSRQPKTLDNWNLVANSAQYLLQVCAPNVDSVGGQNFEADNWNTIVRHDSC